MEFGRVVMVVAVCAAGLSPRGGGLSGAGQQTRPDSVLSRLAMLAPTRLCGRNDWAARHAAEVSVWREGGRVASHRRGWMHPEVCLFASI